MYKVDTVNVESNDDIKRVLDSIVSVEYEYYGGYGSNFLEEDSVEAFKSVVLRNLEKTVKYPETMVYDKSEDVYHWGRQGADAREGWIIKVEDNFILDQNELF